MTHAESGIHDGRQEVFDIGHEPAVTKGVSHVGDDLSPAVRQANLIPTADTSGIGSFGLGKGRTVMTFDPVLKQVRVGCWLQWSGWLIRRRGKLGGEPQRKGSYTCGQHGSSRVA